MNDIKEKFFNEGFISKINLFQKNEMNMIFDEYQDFLKKKNKLVDLVEHKSKTHLFFPWANKLIRDKRIINLVKEILGENIYCWNSLIFYKKPNSKAFVSMHQDQNYWGIIHDKALSVQLAISNSTEENGCLKLIPRSHKKNFVHKDLTNLNNILARGQSISYNDIDKDDLENIELSQGEGCMFHGNIVHGSFENQSSNPRMLFTMRFLTTDNKIKNEYYYNDATLVSGKDEYYYFNKEKSIDEVSIDELKKIHKKILINQFEKYLKIKLKFNFITKFMMIFFNNDFLRGVVYKLSKKI
tara:strand:- start:112 stop:1008 length:897 start_codon:yes stop_codon:yes gene_type:complete